MGWAPLYLGWLQLAGTVTIWLGVHFAAAGRNGALRPSGVGGTVHSRSEDEIHAIALEASHAKHPWRFVYGAP